MNKDTRIYRSPVPNNRTRIVSPRTCGAHFYTRARRVVKLGSFSSHSYDLRIYHSHTRLDLSITAARLFPRDCSYTSTSPGSAHQHESTASQLINRPLFLFDRLRPRAVMRP